MVLEPVPFPSCQSIDVYKHGRSAEGKSRYRCLNPDCQRSTFVKLCQWEDVEAEADGMWSFVGDKSQQRCGSVPGEDSPGHLPWLWHAIDHHSGAVLAYVLATHEDEVFVKLKGLLEPFGITQFYTDGWGAYERLLNPAEHTVGKRNAQKIECKHLTFRTRIKRLARKTICFSKSIVMHDVVIGVFINRFEFGCAV